MELLAGPKIIDGHEWLVTDVNPAEIVAITRTGARSFDVKNFGDNEEFSNTSFTVDRENIISYDYLLVSKDKSFPTACWRSI
jgi:hypothetical protein